MKTPILETKQRARLSVEKIVASEGSLRTAEAQEPECTR